MIRYSNFENDYVVDELCECGHFKSQHGSLTKKIEDRMYREPNGGSCCYGKCACRQFTYVKDITLDEAADVKLAARNQSEGVVVADNSGNFLYWNDRARDLVGLGPSEGISPTKWSEIYGCYKDEDCLEEWPVEELPLTLAMQGRYVEGVLMYVKNKSHKVGRWLKISGEPLKSKRGGLIIFEEYSPNFIAF